MVKFIRRNSSCTDFCVLERACFAICFHKNLDLNISHISIANVLKKE